MGYLSSLIIPYLDILDINQEVIETESHFFKDAMPIYVNSSSDFKSLIEAGDLPEICNINGINLDTKGILTEYTAFFLHIKSILKPLHDYIQILNGEKNVIPKAQLIAELERLFHLASMTPFPDFKRLMPSLQEELANNLPFIGERLNDFYQLLADQLSLYLGIDNLGFKTQIFPNPNTNNYIVLDLEKKGYSNNTPKHLKTKTQKSEPENTPIKKLDFSSLNEEQYGKTRFSPQKRKPIKISQPQYLDSNISDADQSKVEKKKELPNTGHLRQEANLPSIREENKNRLAKASFNDLILRERLESHLKPLTNELVSDLLVLQKFHQTKVLSENHPDFDEDYNNSLDRFYEGALTIRLSDRPIKAQANEIANLANEEFQPRHSTRRLIADVLMVISVLFGGLGLVLMLSRVLQIELYFLAALLQIENNLRSELREFEDLNEVENDARLFRTILA